MVLGTNKRSFGRMNAVHERGSKFGRAICLGIKAIFTWRIYVKSIYLLKSKQTAKQMQEYILKSCRYKRQVYTQNNNKTVEHQHYKPPAYRNFNHVLHEW